MWCQPGDSVVIIFGPIAISLQPIDSVHCHPDSWHLAPLGDTYELLLHARTTAPAIWHDTLEGRDVWQYYCDVQSRRLASILFSNGHICRFSVVVILGKIIALLHPHAEMSMATSSIFSHLIMATWYSLGSSASPNQLRGPLDHR